MKPLFLSLMLIASILFVLPSCKPAEGHDQASAMNMDSIKAQVATLEANYAKGSNAKDIDAVAAYYANDAESLAPDEPTRVGMDAIKAGIKREMDADSVGHKISFETTGVWGGGNYVTETGKIMIADSTGKPQVVGKYMTLFEMRDGKLVAIRDIWNNDKPKK